MRSIGIEDISEESQTPSHSHFSDFSVRETAALDSAWIGRLATFHNKPPRSRNCRIVLADRREDPWVKTVNERVSEIGKLFMIVEKMHQSLKVCFLIHDSVPTIMEVLKRG